MSKNKLSNERFQLLRHINEITDKPFIFLSLIWVILTILEFTTGISQNFEYLVVAIWILFAVDFLIEFIIAPHKANYLRTNWLTAISLVLPAFRILRLFRGFRLLKAVRAVRSVSLVRIIASINRGTRTIRNLLQGRGVKYVFALSVLIIFAGAAGIQYFENPQALRESGIRPEEVGGITGYGDALWWSAMLLTTLGSEYWPHTPEGRILTFLLALYSFAFFSYVIANIASLFIGKDIRKQN